MEGWAGQELQLPAGLGTPGAPFTCGCSSPERQKPFRDITEMSMLHLGIIISEKGGSLV